MKGYFGIGLIAIGIFVAVMGGYILNADTISTCSTEWEYVTDVGVAFQGDDSDMDVSYNPIENIIGWSYTDSYNNKRISGVDFGETTATNTYRAVTGDAETVGYTLSLTATDYDGDTPNPAYLAQITGFPSYSGNMPSEFGLANTEAVTMFRAGLDGYQAGVFAIPLSDLARIVPDYERLYTLELDVTMSGVTPCIASVDINTSVGYYTHIDRTYRVVYENVYAKAYSDTAVIHCKEAFVDFGGTNLSLDNAYLIWGYAQFNSTSPYDADVDVSLTATFESPWAYVDPAAGVVPVYGSYETVVMQSTNHPTSSSPSMTISFEDSGLATGTISADGVEIAAWIGNAEQSAHVVSVTPTGGQQVVASGSGLSGSIEVSVSSGLFTFSFAGDTATYQASATAFSTMSVSIEVTGTLPWVVEIEKDDGTATRFSGSSSRSDMVADLSYVTYTSTPTTVSYSTVYWYNGKSEQNAQVRLALTADSLPASNTFLFRGPDGNTSLNIRCDLDGVWTVGGVNVGKWTGIELTVGFGQATVLPISQFRNFLDYEVVGTETVVVSQGAVGGGTIVSIAVDEPSSGSSLRMCVVSTIVRILKGGLYLQDGVLDMGAAFPSSEALSIMIGSAAIMGESISFTCEGSTATIAVDADRHLARIAGAWYDLNGVTFRWYSPGATSTSIDGETFGPAIYHNGGIYDSGKIWAEVDGGKMVDIMDAPSAWTITLDGVWAPSVFLYEGENVASSSVELGDFASGVYQWDKNTFIIVMMAVSIGGGIVGSYFRIIDAWDWVAIVGTVGVLWVIL